MVEGVRNFMTVVSVSVAVSIAFTVGVDVTVVE